MSIHSGFEQQVEEVDVLLADAVPPEEVLEICYQLATMKKQATQRELFYRLLADSPDYFHKQRDESSTGGYVDCTKLGTNGLSIPGNIWHLENPAGLSIICTYKFGSARMGLEAPKYACDIKWLGIRASDLQYISERGFLPLTHRDRVKGQNLLASKLLENYGPYKEELSYMLENGKRAEIEALHGQGFDFLARLVAQKCASGDYI
eukprot:jgi/Mesen1/1879/ME000143S00934